MISIGLNKQGGMKKEQSKFKESFPKMNLIIFIVFFLMCQIKHMPILHIEIPPAAPNNLPLPPKTTQTKKKDPHPTHPPKNLIIKSIIIICCVFFLTISFSFI